ncbi:hypothetical protein [Streptomyces liliifuscus]|uniref:Uncharacterized protein n=1 Tax=Streptomyces liliifuscus TaxID=2797636 RepID=A0A7T7KXB9_9ACTN|nr:hypothetical protein [Streptomyces liliifuscus]QQM41991.1 hypothetical protein JEQ17_22790 [Streptomyces liliifuscus]
MTITRDDKKKVREELRGLRYDLKVWTLKAPGSHPELGAVCHEHRSWRRGIAASCEPCTFVAFRAEKAGQVRAEIRTLNDRLNGRTPEPEPATRKATVITGSGEQLVMFV